MPVDPDGVLRKYATADSNKLATVEDGKAGGLAIVDLMKVAAEARGRIKTARAYLDHPDPFLRLGARQMRDEAQAEFEQAQAVLRTQILKQVDRDMRRGPA